MFGNSNNNLLKSLIHLPKANKRRYAWNNKQEQSLNFLFLILLPKKPLERNANKRRYVLKKSNNNLKMKTCLIPVSIYLYRTQSWYCQVGAMSGVQDHTSLPVQGDDCMAILLRLASLLPAVHRQWPDVAFLIGSLNLSLNILFKLIL